MGFLVASSSSIRDAVTVLSYVALATGISVAMTLFLKWFLHVWTGTGYPFATTMTCLTMFLQWFFSYVLQTHTGSKTPPPPLARAVYWKLAVPIGLCTSLDFLCSNLALTYITVTFFTIVKSASHVWTLLFSIWLGHQRASWSLCLVILLICCGIALSSYGSTSFDVRGLLLVLAASIFGTLRWVLTQSLLEALGKDVSVSSSSSSSPVSFSRHDNEPPSKSKILIVVHHISPSSALGLVPVAMAIDGKQLIHSEFLTQPRLLWLSLLLIFATGCFAFALLVVKIVLIKKTSALTLGISGSVRDITQIVLAVVLFGDSLGVINIVGLSIATCGILSYSLLNHQKSDSDTDEEDLEDGYELSTITPTAAEKKHSDRLGDSPC